MLASGRGAQVSPLDQAAMVRPAIDIVLTGGQVDQVVRAADGGGGTLAVLLGGLGGLRGVFAGDALREAFDDPRLSRSLLLGLGLLAALPGDGSYVRLREVVQATGLNTSTAHRYLNTLVMAGLIERDPQTRRYRLSITPNTVPAAGCWVSDSPSGPGVS